MALYLSVATHSEWRGPCDWRFGSGECPGDQVCIHGKCENACYMTTCGRNGKCYASNYHGVCKFLSDIISYSIFMHIFLHCWIWNWAELYTFPSAILGFIKCKSFQIVFVVVLLYVFCSYNSIWAPGTWAWAHVWVQRVGRRAASKQVARAGKRV